MFNKKNFTNLLQYIKIPSLPVHPIRRVHKTVYFKMNFYASNLHIVIKQDMIYYPYLQDLHQLLSPEPDDI